MQFMVKIDDRAWAKFARRLARHGITGEPAEVLEALIATTLTDESARPMGLGDNPATSTSILMTLGRVKVERIGDPPQPLPGG